MVIDVILNRHDNEKCGDFNYSAHDFYWEINEYAAVDGVGNEICNAMDELEEEDVKAALCKYIDDYGYNPYIKEYINARTWLEDTYEPLPLVDIMHD